MDFDTLMHALLTPEAPADPNYLSTLCRYTNKHCFNERAFKRSGERHSLCEYHRRKANDNQRRLQRRRRASLVRSAIRHSRSGATPCGTIRRRVACDHDEDQTPTSLDLATMAACHHGTEAKRWKPAASMTIDDMARILAEENDALYRSLHTTTKLVPLLDTEAATSCASSCTSDDDDAASSVGSDSGVVGSPMPLQLDSTRSMKHTLGFDATWAVDQVPDLAARVHVDASIEALFGAPWDPIESLEWPHDSVFLAAAPLSTSTNY